MTIAVEYDETPKSTISILEDAILIIKRQDETEQKLRALVDAQKELIEYLRIQCNDYERKYKALKYLVNSSYGKMRY